MRSHHPLKDYRRLHTISKKIKIFSSIIQSLLWDRETFMPIEGAGIRSDQEALLTVLVHKKKTGRKFANALGKLIDLETGSLIAKQLPQEYITALKLWRQDYIKAKAFPKSFIEKDDRQSSQAVLAWRSAKKNNDFGCFKPFLEARIDMARRKADFLGYTKHPYDALLDDFEPGMTTREIDILFNRLKQALTPLLRNISGKKQVNDSFLFKNVIPSEQIRISKLLLTAMGYDFTKGRLDISSHPTTFFCHSTDVRVTTSIRPGSLMNTFSIVMHEGGHALYEMGLPLENFGSPLGEAISFGFHESQSRWWQNIIGHSKPFWEYFLPILKKELGGLDKVTLDEFYRAINKIEPSLIRLDADEITYHFHIFLRYEIERGLIEGSLKASDIPEVWNEKMQRYLGLTPKNDAEGCLQDIHWAMWSFGYFPFYTFGTLFAAHMALGFEKDFPDWRNRVKQGDLCFVVNWLRQSIYQHGRRYTSLELLKKINGSDFSEKAFVSYLNNKYQDIYNL